MVNRIFVDDNTIVFTYKDTSFNPATVEKLFEMADEVLDTWQKLVVITGGDIELDKSSISILAWQKAKGKELMLESNQFKKKLTMHSVKLPGYSEPVDLLERNHGERLLGVCLVIDGSNAVELKFWQDQVVELAEKVRTGPPLREDAETIYRKRWVNSV